MNIKDPTVIMKCSAYDAADIYEKLKFGLEKLGVCGKPFSGKKIAIKPNLLLGYTPDKAATTNPAVVEAVITLARSLGGEDIVIAESPGGPYNETTLRSIYRETGMTKVSEKTGVPLNFSTDSKEIGYPDGVVSKVFTIIEPLNSADVILNVCKLKTHNLSKMTCAVKNLFGSVPGITKFEMHARYKDQRDFLSMLVDLCTMICQNHRVIHICDAITGMEGNGPSGGTPRNIGALLISENPFCLDTAAAEIIGLSGEVEMLDEAVKRGLCPKSVHELSLIGEPLENVAVKDFVKPDNSGKKKFNLIPGFLRPRPEIDKKKCVGCGTCVRSCPAKTISMPDKKARINPKHCLKCYCCQELCTFKAVRIKKSFIYRLIK